MTTSYVRSLYARITSSTPCFFISSLSSASGFTGIPLGYNEPESSGGYVLHSIPGICVAVKATTSKASLFLKQTLKLWKSRPAAPIMITFLLFIAVHPCAPSHYETYSHYQLLERLIKINGGRVKKVLHSEFNPSLCKKAETIRNQAHFLTLRWPQPKHMKS